MQVQTVYDNQKFQSRLKRLAGMKAIRNKGQNSWVDLTILQRLTSGLVDIKHSFAKGIARDRNRTQAPGEAIAKKKKRLSGASGVVPKEAKKLFSFSLIERVILSAGAMLIFSVSFQIDQMDRSPMDGCV